MTGSEISSTDTEPALEADNEIADATTGASVLRGGLWSATSKVAPQFFTLAVSIVGAHVLGPRLLGRQSFIAFVATSAIYVLGFGIPLSLMRQIGESLGAGRAPQARGLIMWAWRFAGAGASVGVLGLLGVAFAGAVPQAAWILAALTVGVGILTAIPDAILSGLQKWRDNSTMVLLANALGAAATIGVLFAGGGVTGMLAVQFIVAVLIFGGLGARARIRLRAVVTRSEDPGELRGKTLRYAASIFLGALLTLIVFRRSEFFFLEHYSGDRAVALYSVAFSAMATLVLMPQALANVVSPAVATLLGAGQIDRIRSGYGRTLRLLLLGAVPIAASGIALGPEVLRLVFGSRFRGSGAPLEILLVPFPLIPLMNASYSLIVGLRKVAFPLISGAASAAVNVGLDFALIPGHGALGAAVANSSAQALTAVVIVTYGIRSVHGIEWQASALARLIATSVLAGLAARVALDATGGGLGGLALGLLVGAVVFVVLARLLGIISRPDGKWLRDTAATLLGGRVARAVRWVEVR
jgi:O-antigen/teichoic acid export membrane protein